MALPDEEGSRLIANVLQLQYPHGGNALAALPGAAAVIIQNPSNGATPRWVAVALLYGLTNAERNVHERVTSSNSPQETADRLGVSVNTVKTHLRKIFGENQYARQANLVRLIAPVDGSVEIEAVRTPTASLMDLSRLQGKAARSAAWVFALPRVASRIEPYAALAQARSYEPGSVSSSRFAIGASVSSCFIFRQRPFPKNMT